MNEKRLPWIDWMKVLGMSLIVFGHSGGHTTIPPITHPFNPKQLGVAFFVFITGYTLSSENRPSSNVIFRRLFDVYVWTGLTAVVLSVVSYISIGDLNESNYLPLALGLNVFDNNFPANPTTWYVGCYLHLLLLWGCCLRRVSLTRWIVLLCSIEIVMRAALMSIGRDYTAYMLVTNWLTILMLGLMVGQTNNKVTFSTQNAANALGSDFRPSPAVAFLFLSTFTLFWMWIIAAIGITTQNPFGRISSSPGFAGDLLTSCSVTLLYVVYTLGIYALVCGFPEHFLIRFLARNTLLVFLIHMPLIYAVTPLMYPFVPQGIFRVMVNQFLFFLLVAMFSEAMLTIIRLQNVKRWCFRRAFDG